MFLMVECPDELFSDAFIPSVMTGDGVRLEAVEQVPAGPWLATVLDSIDPQQLSEWDLPAYLRAATRVQAWAAARLSDGVAELASRPGGFGADKEVALALRELVGVAQRRIHHARRLRRMLPTTRRLFRWGAISEKQAGAIVEATTGVYDPSRCSRPRAAAGPVLKCYPVNRCVGVVPSGSSKSNPSGIAR